MRYNDYSNIPVKCKLCRFFRMSRTEHRPVCTHRDGKDFVLACCAFAQKRTETALKALKSGKAGKTTGQGAKAPQNANGGKI